MNGKKEPLNSTGPRTVMAPRDLIQMPPKRDRAAIYLRVSSDKQTTECQRPDVEHMARVRGLRVVAEFDEQRSACRARPEFERMLAAARDGQFDVLVIWALDRFGRSMSGNLNDVLKLDKLGIKVVSVREPWMDTAGPVRELLIAIFGWVAQHERLRLIERTKAGIANARLGGKKWGRSSPSLAAVDKREEIMALWSAHGKPAGYRGLGDLLGGCTGMTARRLWIARQASLGMPYIAAPARPRRARTQNTDVSDVDVLD